VIYGILRAGKLFFGRKKLQLPGETLVVFTETAIVFGDQTILFEDLFYRKGDTKGAIDNWRKALSIHPKYKDALYALSFVGATP